MHDMALPVNLDVLLLCEERGAVGSLAGSRRVPTPTPPNPRALLPDRDDFFLTWQPGSSFKPPLHNLSLVRLSKPSEQYQQRWPIHTCMSTQRMLRWGDGSTRAWRDDGDRP